MSVPAPERVAIYGGSFNPPHVAHLLAVTLALATAEIDRVLVVPTFKHPFAKALAPYDDRVEMCALAMGWLPRVEVSRVEEELGGESRTLRTLEHLREAHPGWSMRLLMGADLVLEAPRWYRFEAIAAIAPPLVVGRAGVEAAGAPAAVLPAVSSTDVRALIAGDSAHKWEELAQLVPRDALALIRARKLYTGAYTGAYT